LWLSALGLGQGQAPFLRNTTITKPAFQQSLKFDTPNGFKALAFYKLRAEFENHPTSFADSFSFILPLSFSFRQLSVKDQNSGGFFLENGSFNCHLLYGFGSRINQYFHLGFFYIDFNHSIRENFLWMDLPFRNNLRYSQFRLQK
jgi:hypothetical protein